MAGLALVGCSGSSDKRAKPTATPCSDVTPIDDLSLLPADIPLTDFGDVIAASVKKGFLVVELRSDQLVIEADPPIQRELLAAGYEVLSHDNEGFEAEIFFARGQDVVGTFTLRNLCTEQIQIRLLYGSTRYEKMKDT